MISRIWHGFTTPENADIYETLLKEEIFIAIGNRSIKGYQGIQLLRSGLLFDHEGTRSTHEGARRVTR
jgi:hypothetical protein